MFSFLYCKGTKKNVTTKRKRKLFTKKLRLNPNYLHLSNRIANFAISTLQKNIYVRIFTHHHPNG